MYYLLKGFIRRTVTHQNILEQASHFIGRKSEKEYKYMYTCTEYGGV